MNTPDTVPPEEHGIPHQEEPQRANLSVFYVSVDRIDPNPFQPRREFSESGLEGLARSVRQYGVLQPLVVIKKETVGDMGDMSVRYELVAGERRLRASKMAGLSQVPVVIRADVHSDSMLLELAIIENLQREDLNPVDRARAFKRLIDDFSMTHTEVAHRMGRSREYVSNSLRLLTLPEDMVQAVTDNRISEGHTRPLLMLSDDSERQRALFDEIVNRKITVREAEIIARRHARDRVRKRHVDPYIQEAQSVIEGLLETRVSIRSQGKAGGKIVIDYFSGDGLKEIVERLQGQDIPEQSADTELRTEIPTEPNTETPDDTPDDADGEDDLYSIRNFSL